MNDAYAVYKYWLRHSACQDRQFDKQLIQQSVEDSLTESSSYQTDALRNGEPQPLAAIRTETNKCKIILLPGSEMNIGDLVYVFNEHWICMEIQIDEYGVKSGEIWMCNHIFNYQDHVGNIINKYAIIDSGSYSKGSDKALPVTSGNYNCYISLDDESRALYVDKRLAIDTNLDSKNKKILEFGKIIWCDEKTHNFGEGSHLLVFGLTDDVYNAEHDNIELMICDYKNITQDEEKEEDTIEVVVETEDNFSGYLTIQGRDTMRIGTGRTYKAVAVDLDGNSLEPQTDLIWGITNQQDGISITPKGDSCIVRVDLEDNLIGTTFEITCEDRSGTYAKSNKEVVVISIG